MSRELLVNERRKKRMTVLCEEEERKCLRGISFERKR